MSNFGHNVLRKSMDYSASLVITFQHILVRVVFPVNRTCTLYFEITHDFYMNNLEL